MSDRLKMHVDGVDYELEMTCGACPEQYDVFRNGDQVAYLRLRNGWFRADVPRCGGETVYEAYPEGDGIFDADEREPFLTSALMAVTEHYRNLWASTRSAGAVEA